MQSPQNESGSRDVILDPEQIDAFHRHGFVVVPQMSDAAEVAKLTGIFDRMFAAQVGRSEGAQYDILGHDEDGVDARLPTLINPIDYERALRQLVFRSNALAVAQQLLGPKAVPSFEHVILKPARQGGATPWHQDEAYRADPNFEYEQLSVWMALSEVTLDNGCMQCIPGSHRLGVLPHRSFNNDPKVHAIECTGGFDAATAVACPVSAGGATIHHGRTLHYAGPNGSDAPRYAYILAFEVPPKPTASRRDFFWNREKQTANRARKSHWRRRGGVVIEVWRKFRRGVWSRPLQAVFEVRRLLQTLLRR